MAAAAILKAVDHFRFCDFLTQHIFLSLCIKFHRNRVVIAHFTPFTSINKMAAAAILKLDLRLCFCDF
jgi:hypothetical protein